MTFTSRYEVDFAMSSAPTLGVKCNTKVRVDYAICFAISELMQAHHSDQRSAKALQHLTRAQGHLSQLLRYYAVTDARFGILTNGVVYQFYTDLVKRNVMDEEPFLVVNMLELSDDMVVEVCRFAKSEFDAQAIWDLVNTREKEQKELQIITDNIAREFASPSKEMVRILARGVLGKGYQKPSEWERVTDLTKRVLDQHTGTGVAAESRGESSHFPAKTEEKTRKERQREAGRKAAESRRQNLAIQQQSEEPDYSKYKYWQRLMDTPELHSLFVALRDYARSLGDDVKVNPTQEYIGLWRQATLAFVRLQPGYKRLLVYVITDLERTAPHEGFTKPLPKESHFGRCNLQRFSSPATTTSNAPSP